MKLSFSFLMLAIAQAAFGALGDTVATPEPATLGLLGAGLAGIGLVAWRRNRKR